MNRPMTNGAPAQASVATWHPLDENGWAELRVNGRRITTLPSYPAAEEAAERNNEALSPPPTVGAEDEAARAWMLDLANRLRRVPCEHIDGADIDRLVEIARGHPAPAADGQRVKAKDWLAVAKAAGQHGVRYRTNRALEAFLSDIRACLATDKEGA